MNALSISVYRNNLYRGCSNNGVSENFNELLLICEDGNTTIDETNKPENLVVLVTRKIGGREYKHIEPYQDTKTIWYMAGGAIGYSCDSRFRAISEYPLQIHDRMEK